MTGYTRILAHNVMTGDRLANVSGVVASVVPGERIGTVVITTQFGVSITRKPLDTVLVLLGTL